MENEKVYVNVYDVIREFGGYEEGGWWYDWYECIETIPCKLEDSEKIAENLRKDYSDLPNSDIEVSVEKSKRERQTLEAPIYE